MSATHLEIVVVYDDEHVQHLAADARRGWQDADDVREEVEGIESGAWTPYGVTVARVCDCCQQVTEPYVTALWGCVVRDDDVAGRYASPDEITEPYIREVAEDVMREALA